MSGFLEVGTVVDFFSVIENRNVKLKVEKSKQEYCCDGCYFINFHCPNEWDCGKEARKDRQAIIFKEIKNA